MVLLPFFAWLLVRSLQLEPTMAAGLLLVAACPCGAMANIYTHLGQANLALSVTLSAVSYVAAIVSTPLTLAILDTPGEGSTGFAVPFSLLAGHLFVILVLPFTTGMVLRSRWPHITSGTPASCL